MYEYDDMIKEIILQIDVGYSEVDGLHDWLPYSNFLHLHFNHEVIT